MFRSLRILAALFFCSAVSATVVVNGPCENCTGTPPDITNGPGGPVYHNPKLKPTNNPAESYVKIYSNAQYPANLQTYGAVYPNQNQDNNNFNNPANQQTYGPVYPNPNQGVFPNYNNNNNFNNPSSQQGYGPANPNPNQGAFQTQQNHVPQPRFQTIINHNPAQATQTTYQPNGQNWAFSATNTAQQGSGYPQVQPSVFATAEAKFNEAFLALSQATQNQDTLLVVPQGFSGRLPDGTYVHNDNCVNCRITDD